MIAFFQSLHGFHLSHHSKQVYRALRSKTSPLYSRNQKKPSQIIDDKITSESNEIVKDPKSLDELSMYNSIDEIFNSFSFILPLFSDDLF